MNNIKNILKVSFVIIGTLIGAGFASGKEIVIFFSKYGEYGIYGIILSAALTGLIVTLSLKIAKENEIKNNKEFIELITNKKEKLGCFTLAIINIFLVISFYIMMAGFAVNIKQELNIPIFISNIVMSIAMYKIFIKKVDGIVKLNSLIVPLLIFITFFISINNIITNGATIEPEITNIKGNWIVSAILYSSYNSIILIPIVVSLREYINEKKDIIKVSMIVTIIFILMAMGIHFLITNYGISNEELPVLNILGLTNSVYKEIYFIAIIIAIFTSAVSAGYELLSGMQIENKEKYKRVAIIFCLMGIPVAYIGFGNLVTYLYPIFGLLGLLEIILIIKNSIAKKDKNWYK